MLQSLFAVDFQKDTSRTNSQQHGGDTSIFPSPHPDLISLMAGQSQSRWDSKAILIQQYWWYFYLRSLIDLSKLHSFLAPASKDLPLPVSARTLGKGRRGAVPSRQQPERGVDCCTHGALSPETSTCRTHS